MASRRLYIWCHINYVPISAVSQYILFPFFVAAKIATTRGGDQQLIIIAKRNQLVIVQSPPLFSLRWIKLAMQLQDRYYNSFDDLTSLMSLILNMLPIDAEGLDALVVKHAESLPTIVGKTKTSIKTKYAVVKRVSKSSTGNPKMPEYVKMTHLVHILIGQKANLGTGEEDFDMKKRVRLWRV